MPGKKQPGRFTIQFNAADPQQRQVIELLNQQGRRKAAFLTSAVLAYYGQAAPAWQPAALEPALVEEVVKKILQQRPMQPAETQSRPPVPPQTGGSPLRPSEPTASTVVEGKETLPADDLAAICDVIDAFWT